MADGGRLTFKILDDLRARVIDAVALAEEELGRALTIREYDKYAMRLVVRWSRGERRVP